jgi:electron transfer flavoprotein alpha subunit
MSTLIVHHEKIIDAKALPALCPFGAIIADSKGVRISESCRMCLLCVKKGPTGVFELCKDEAPPPRVDKSLWQGILVSIEQRDGIIHPVSLELVGKARELARKAGQPLYASVAGIDLGPVGQELLKYGIDTVCIYEAPELQLFRVEPHTAVLEDAIGYLKPAVVLVGGTPSGRMLAPRTAARLHTGLTADCTVLDIQSNGDLDQIRPAFGGNIMAHIRTPNHRPQFATVRYKVFDMALPVDIPTGRIVERSLPSAKLASRIEVLEVHPKGVGSYIEDAQVLVAVGKGIGSQADLGLVERLAEVLGAQVACTRPLVENGWMDPRKQIGLSGRTVRPKLIITCGISGSVQFVAGMKGSEKIIAINSDPHASIFKTAHVGLVGDLFEILPRLIDLITQKGTSFLHAKEASSHV